MRRWRKVRHPNMRVRLHNDAGIKLNESSIQQDQTIHKMSPIDPQFKVPNDLYSFDPQNE
jgi:hypothetical protein